MGIFLRPLSSRLKHSFSLLEHAIVFHQITYKSSEPLTIISLSGHLNIWNYETQTIVKTIEATSNDLPIRTARFIERKSWVVCGTSKTLYVLNSLLWSWREKYFKSTLQYVVYMLGVLFTQ